jgi:hypothetical protein
MWSADLTWHLRDQASQTGVGGELRYSISWSIDQSARDQLTSRGIYKRSCFTDWVGGELTCRGIKDIWPLRLSKKRYQLGDQLINWPISTESADLPKHPLYQPLRLGRRSKFKIMAKFRIHLEQTLICRILDTLPQWAIVLVICLITGKSI